MIADRLDRLALALLERAGDAQRTMLAAAELGAIAAQVRQLEQATVPPHVRADRRALPPGVIALYGRRAPR